MIRAALSTLLLLTAPALAEPVRSLFAETPENAKPERYVPPNKPVPDNYKLFGPAPYDMGGDVVMYLRTVQGYDEDDAKLTITGTCVSACTLLLKAKRVCITSDAMLWFHGISEQPLKTVSARSTISVPDLTKPAVYSAKASEALFKLYPAFIQPWLKASGALSTSKFTEKSYRTGRQMIALGVQECAERDLVEDRGGTRN